MNNGKSNDFFMFKQLCVCFALILFTPLTQAAFDGSTPVLVKSEPSDVITEQVSISDGNGGTWIAWIDKSGINDDDELILSKINSFGTITRAATFLVSSPKTLNSLVLAVDKTDPQSLYLAWTDNINGTDASLFVARFNENFGSGAVQWNKEITASSGNAKENPDLVIANGDPIVAWTDFRTGNPNIRATRLATASGATVWSDRAVVASASSNQNDVSLVAGTGDIDLFVWFTDEGVEERIILARLTVGFGAIDAFTAVTPNLADTILLSPTLIADNNGGVFVAWHQGLQSQPVSIYLARLSSLLAHVDGTVIIKVADTGKNRNSVNYQMRSDGAGGVVLTWVDGRNSSDDVYASKINSLLQPLWGTSGVRVTDSGNNFSVGSPSILADSLGGAFVSYNRITNNSSARQARVNYIDRNTSSDPIGGFPSASAGDSAILQPGTVNLVETSNGVVLSYVGTESSNFFPDKVFAQVFAGAIFPSRIETPIAESPVANASLDFNTSFTLSASDFIMAGNGSHSSSNIEIRDSGDNIVISEQFNGSSTGFSISQVLASNLLTGETYSWRVRYTANTGETSALSTPETFLIVSSKPTITSLVNQSLNLAGGETDVSQSFTLSDPVGNVDDLVVTATSSDQSKVANSAISITGSGSDRSITVSPTTGGTVTITVTATSGSGFSASSQYDISIISAAVISGGLNDRQIILGETTTLTFNIIDGDSPNFAGLQVVATISDTSVIPTSGFAITTIVNEPTTIDITPLKLGVADITISVIDSDRNITTEEFKITVVNESTTTTSSSGGGGSIGFMFVLMFFVLRFMQMIKRSRLVE